MESPVEESMDCDPPLVLSLPFPLFQIIKTEQAQNGVKHSDYARYR
jgi:hypothetical protein